MYIVNKIRNTVGPYYFLRFSLSLFREIIPREREKERKRKERKKKITKVGNTKIEDSIAESFSFAFSFHLWSQRLFSADFESG